MNVYEQNAVALADALEALVNSEFVITETIDTTKPGNLLTAIHNAQAVLQRVGRKPRPVIRMKK